MDAISPEIRLVPKAVPYSFHEFRWQVDLWRKVAHHESGVSFMLSFAFDPDNLGRTVAPPQIYDITARIRRIRAGVDMPSGQELQRLGAEAILAFLIDADLWYPSPRDRPGVAPLRPSLRESASAGEDYAPF